MAIITLKGRIEKIFDPKVYGNVEKRLFWLFEDKELYPNTWELELLDSKCGLIDDYQAGDYIICKVDIIGRKWSKDGKSGVFNSLKCWEIRPYEK